MLESFSVSSLGLLNMFVSKFPLHIRLGSNHIALFYFNYLFKGIIQMKHSLGSGG